MRSRIANILIIGTQDECQAVASAIPRSLQHLREAGEALTVDVVSEDLVLHSRWEVDFAQGHWDLCIFFLTTRDAHLFLGNAKLIQDRAKGVCLISDNRAQLPSSWQLRGDRDFLMCRPFTDNQLCAQIERLLQRIFRRNISDITDGEILGFLRSLLERNEANLSIDPQAIPERPQGFGYPQIAHFFGHNVDEVAVLDHCVSLGLLGKRVHNRLRLCSRCNSHQLNYRQQCPRCSSLDYVQETIIHHFSCGHLDSVQNFYRQGELVCPSCHRRLKHIGVDYEKPPTNHRCQDCNHLFAEAQVAVQCLHCSQVSEPQATREQALYAYQLQPFASQAVTAGSVHAVDLTALLGSSTSGLASRQLFIYELARDIQRYKRYKVPSSVVMVRVNNLDDLQRDLGHELGDYLHMLFTSVSSSLRSLDICCIWDHNLLAVLLPGTPAEGAWIVARRMEGHAASLRLPFSTTGSRISTSVEGVREDTVHYQSVIDAALAIHDTIDEIARRDFMPGS